MCSDTVVGDATLRMAKANPLGTIIQPKNSLPSGKAFTVHSQTLRGYHCLMHRLIPLIIILCASGFGQSLEPAPGPSSLQTAQAPLRWSFEDGTQGWKARDCQIKSASGITRHGSKSLMVNSSFPRAARIEFVGELGVKSLKEIHFWVFVPHGSPADLQAMLYLKDKDGLFYQYLHPEKLQEGWQQIAVDVSTESVGLVPQDHYGHWGGRVAAHIDTLGIKLISRQEYSGEFYIDLIESVAGTTEREPLRILDFKPGPSRLGTFEKFELSFRLNREFKNPFDPTHIQVDAEFKSPTEGYTIPGFYSQDFVRSKDNPRRERFLVDDLVAGSNRAVNSELTVERWEEMIPMGAPSWKVRFTPMEPGAHKYRLIIKTGSKTIESQWHSFIASPSNKPGFVRVCKTDPRYFEFSNGDFFYPIGHNVRSPFDERWWATVLEKEKLPPDKGTYAYDDILRKMHENGENLAEIWMASWWLAIEWTSEWRGFRGLTDYNLANASKLDYMLEIADKNDIYYHLVLDNHGKASTWCDPEWINNPYNADNGGPAYDVEDYFTNQEAKDTYKKTLRYIVARWAYSPRIMGIELWSELDLTGASFDFKNSAVKADWHREIGQELRNLDAFKHLVTTHYSTDWRRLDPNVVSLPQIDYVVVDAYRSRKSIVELIDQTYERASQYGKPCFVTEYGGSPWATSAAQVIPLLKADLQAGLWATYMTPSAASPLLWWFEFIDHQDQYFRYKALANYAKGEDRRNQGLYQNDAAGAIVAGNAFDKLRLSAKVLTNGQRAYAWVYDQTAMESWPQEGTARTFSGASLSLAMGFGDYTYEVWDTVTGKVVQKENASVTGTTISIPLPEFTIDCAIKVKPRGSGLPAK